MIKTKETRFGFGKNWKNFISVMSEDRILLAENSLRELIGKNSLEGLTFIDIGSGSGLFSLAAKRLGAKTIHSFDYDLDSVECTKELKQRFFPNDTTWTVESGSILDNIYLKSLGTFDIVYSWGVLHHTGQMIHALNNAAELVNKKGELIIAIYNDQGILSKIWWHIKKMYCEHLFWRVLILSTFVPIYLIGGFIKDLINLRSPLRRYTGHLRGMSFLFDWMDWLGGFPFEVASRKFIIEFYGKRDFTVNKIISCANKSGCNQFSFIR
jgi:2-polyprenyl-6-hydroxyphenyl methylase/3-demethylubiquinone-9 3-methyltransferase